MSGHLIYIEISNRHYVLAIGTTKCCMGSLKALATQKTRKLEERAKIEKYHI